MPQSPLARHEKRPSPIAILERNPKMTVTGMLARRRTRHTTTGLLAAVALFGGALSAQADIKIGEIGPLTGDAAANGNSQREGIEMAVKEKNAAGGLLGQQITVILGDDAGKPEQAISVAKRLTSQDEVAIILGSTSSPTSFAISQVAAEAETPEIVVGGTAQKLTLMGNKWLFRSAVPDVKLAADLADFIHERYPAKTKIAFVYVNDDYGKGGLDAFKVRADKDGMTVVADEKYARGDLDFSSQLSRVKSTGAEILVDWSRYTESALITKQMKQMGLDIPHFGGDGQSTPKFLELAGVDADGMYYATHFAVATSAEMPAAQVFVKNFREMFHKDPDSMDAEAYDAGKAAILAIEAAGSTDRDKIRDALAKVSFDGTRGRFAFDAKGDPLFAAHVVLIKDGKETNGRDGTQK
jgi:branched-chain amino acid transport system substrate-binding protein